VPLRSAAAIWSKEFPGVEVVPCPRILYLGRTKRAKIDKNEMLTPVVIGLGNHLEGKCPMVSTKLHFNCYRELFTLLWSRSDVFKTMFRPKYDYVEELGNIPYDDPSYLIEKNPPLEIDWPNMVFVAVNFASTALLEGICRGIPAMIARNAPVQDYLLIG